MPTNDWPTVGVVAESSLALTLAIEPVKSLLRIGVADDQHFGDLLAVLGQRDVERRLAADLYLLRVVAEEGDGERLAGVAPTEKSPARPVTLPRLVSKTITLAPMTGSPKSFDRSGHYPLLRVAPSVRVRRPVCG